MSERLLSSLQEDPHDLSWRLGAVDAPGEDEHLALYCCYELHYQGLAGVHPDWEWEPSLLAVRRQLERGFLADLKGAVDSTSYPAGSVTDRLWAMAAGDGGPSLSAWVAERGTPLHLRELAVHRSAYQLKEADPHTWGIPRLSGAAKAAMVTIQADEYGNGVPGRMHCSLFAATMESLGLDPAPNRYLDRIPGVTLATANLISMFGLHRRWRGALVGHLALFEMTSIGPMRRYAEAIRRLGLADSAARFYDVHVEADRAHQYVAAYGMVDGLLQTEPNLAADVLFGAAALQRVEARFSSHVLDRWERGHSSLR